VKRAPDAQLPPHITPQRKHHPGVVGTLIGDGIAQGTSYLSQRRKVKAGARPPRFQYDVARAARLCLYAAVIGSPIGHYWFALLDKVGCVS